MGLLFDQNLSRRLLNRLADVFPGSQHVYHLGLARAGDAEIWDYARAHNLIIVTKDADFADLHALHGAPPKVVWVRAPSATTNAIEALLRDHAPEIAAFMEDPTAGMMELT